MNFQELDILNKESWEKLPSYEIIVSNPPYIPQREKDLMGKSVLNHEPSLALFVTNEDPLIFYRTIIEFSKKQLTNVGGFILKPMNLMPLRLKPFFLRLDISISKNVKTFKEKTGC